jgi:glutamine amidotransferase
VRAGEVATHSSVVVATERMDEDAGWTQLDAGVLMHVARDLTVTRTAILDGPPRRPLTLADLGEAAASQRP